MIRVLEMTFKKQDGKSVKMVVPNPREDLTGPEIKSAMESIINKNIFAPGGVDLLEVEGARIITTQEETVNL